MILRQTEINSNILLSQLNGMFGGVVLKRYKDQIILSMRPAKSKKKPTRLQADNRYTMKNAVHFAKGVIQDPVQKALWEERVGNHRNVFQAALSWYLKECK
jgi:hypothetical protein